MQHLGPHLLRGTGTSLGIEVDPLVDRRALAEKFEQVERRRRHFQFEKRAVGREARSARRLELWIGSGAFLDPGRSFGPGDGGTGPRRRQSASRNKQRRNGSRNPAAISSTLASNAEVKPTSTKRSASFRRKESSRAYRRVISGRFIAGPPSSGPRSSCRPAGDSSRSRHRRDRRHHPFRPN